MNDYWFVITGWHDDQGRLRRRAEHWADSSSFSPDALAAASDTAKAKLLSRIYTLDVPAGSTADRLNRLLESDRNRVITAILLDIVPIPAGDPRWIHYDVARAGKRLDDSALSLLTTEYGISLYRLTDPFDIVDEAAATSNA